MSLGRTLMKPISIVAWLKELTGEEYDRMKRLQATSFFAQTATTLDFEVECSEFDCLDWPHGDARLVSEGKSFEGCYRISPRTSPEGTRWAISALRHAIAAI